MAGRNACPTRVWTVRPPRRITRTMAPPPTPSADAPPSRRAVVSDDVAYILPMATFLVFIWLGTNETVKRYVPHAYAVAYVCRAAVVAAMLALFWRHYTKIRWTHLWL